MDTINNNPTLRNLISGLFAILILFVAIKTIAEMKTISYIGKSTTVPNTISVSGKGEIFAAPDVATFTFSVSEEAPIVKTAQDKVEEKMDAILADLKKNGVEDKDIKTIAYDIYPRYDYIRSSYDVSGKQVLSAYVVSQSVQIKVKKLEDAGKLLSGIGEFGATNISGLTFLVDKQDEIARNARDQAIADAREQANKLAQSLGVKIIGITSFYETSPYQPYPMYAKEMSLGMGGDGAQSAVTLPTGENKITSNVTITYEIK